MADMVEVTRCKDCQYCQIFIRPKQKGIGYPYCHYGKEPVSVWAKTVSSLIASHHERVDRSEDIRKAGYDIEIEARKLQDMYIELEKQI